MRAQAALASQAPFLRLDIGETRRIVYGSDDEAAQPKMVEQQVEVEILTADFEVVLAADEGETFSQFEDKRAEMLEQTAP